MGLSRSDPSAPFPVHLHWLHVTWARPPEAWPQSRSLPTAPGKAHSQLMGVGTGVFLANAFLPTLMMVAFQEMVTSALAGTFVVTQSPPCSSRKGLGEGGGCQGHIHVALYPRQSWKPGLHVLAKHLLVFSYLIFTTTYPSLGNPTAFGESLLYYL